MSFCCWLFLISSQAEIFIENKQVKLEKHGLNSYVFISHNIKQVKSGGFGHVTEVEVL